MEGYKGCIGQTVTKQCHSQGFAGILSSRQLKENNLILLLGGEYIFQKENINYVLK